jgi:hypothetical protein
MLTSAPNQLPAAASSSFAEFFDLSRWVQWLSELDRGFLFLLLLPLVVAAVGLWAHFFGEDGEK